MPDSFWNRKGLQKNELTKSQRPFVGLLRYSGTFLPRGRSAHFTLSDLWLIFTFPWNKSKQEMFGERRSGKGHMET